MTRKEAKVRRGITMGVITTLLVGTMWGTLYTKSHRIRECEVFSINEESITVIHPNGLDYMYYHYDDALPNRVKEGDYIEVSFDEMHDWEKYYSINELKKVK